MMQHSVRAVLIACLLYCYNLEPSESGFIASSSINYCSETDVRNETGQHCGKMLVIALTVTGNEVYNIHARTHIVLFH